VGELLRVRTATGDAAEASPGSETKKDTGKETEKKDAGEAGKDGAGKAGTREDKAEATRTLLRGLDLPRFLDKPVLVYFHWPHEDGKRGKDIVKFCTGPLDDEAFARLSALFHCVEVNTRDSDQRLVEEAKVRATPTLMVLREDRTVAWRTEDSRVNGKRLAGSLLQVLKEEFPDRWKAVEAELEAQKKHLREADASLQKKDLEAASFSLRMVVDSDCRFTDEWEKARKVLADVERALAKKDE